MRLQRFRWLALSVGLLILAGCSHRRRIAAYPPPPAIGHMLADSRADAEFVAAHRPISSETGVASWYGAPYHNRRGANGQVYRQDGLSAANRTLPLETLIEVTNLETGQAAVMRVTDRGPFVPGRILDLSRGAAKAIGVFRPGTARVRIDVYAAPTSIDTGGRWCVQIGAFSSGRAARKLSGRLTRRYHSANVIEFEGPTGYWVRIRPFHDEKKRAVEIARSVKPSQGNAYLVRLD